jgi:hypothetical protein
VDIEFVKQPLGIAPGDIGIVESEGGSGVHAASLPASISAVHVVGYHPLYILMYPCEHINILHA